MWVSLRRELPFEQFARYVLQELGRPVTDPQANEERLLRELVLRLNDPNGAVRMLVVIDHAEAAIARSDWDWYGQFLQAWAAQGRGSGVLVTSRSPLASETTIPTLYLGGLTEAEGIALFDRLKVTGTQRSTLVAVAEGHPLKLNLCARWTTQTYGGQVDERTIDFFTKLFSIYQGDPEAGVEAVFDVIFEALPGGLQDLLVRLSVYRLPFDEQMAHIMRTELRSLQLSLFQEFQLDLQRPLLKVTKIALKTLDDQGLLLSQGEQYVLHPLVEQFVRSRLTKEFCQVAHEQAIDFYTAHYKPWDGTLASCQSELEAFYHACELGEYQRAYDILNRCVNQLDLAGQWRSLLPLYQRLTNEWQTANHDDGQNLGWAWIQSGNLHRNLGNYSEAIATHQRAKTIFEGLGYQSGIAASLGGLGIAYQFLGQYQRAIDLHQQSLEIKRELGDRKDEARSLVNLGIAYQSLGQYQRAIDLHQQSLEIDRELGDRQGEAYPLGNLGNAYHSLRQYQRAIDLHEQSLEIERELGNRQGEARSLGSLGNAYQCLGQYQRSIDLNQKSLEIMRELGDRQGEADSLGNLGNAYQSLGQYQRAIDLHQQSLEIERELGNQGGIANSLWRLAHLYQQLGRLRLAMHYRHQAYQIWKVMHLPLAAAPLAKFQKNLMQNMGDDWAQEMITNEKAMAWLALPMGYLLFALRSLLSPLTYLQKRLKIPLLFFWFAVGLSMVILIWWVKR